MSASSTPTLYLCGAWKQPSCAGHAFANAALAGNNADHFFDVAFCVRRFMLRRTAGTVSVAVAAIVGTCFTHVGIAPFICAGRGAATAPFRHRSPFCGMGRTLLVYRVRAQNASTIKTNSTPNQQKCPNCMGDTSSWNPAINRSNAEYTGFIRAKGAAKTALRGKTYLKNAALLTVAGFALRALGMVFRVFVAARLGPEGMGRVSADLIRLYGVWFRWTSAGINVASTG